VTVGGGVLLSGVVGSGGAPTPFWGQRHGHFDRPGGVRRIGGCGQQKAQCWL